MIYMPMAVLKCERRNTVKKGIDRVTSFFIAFAMILTTFCSMTVFADGEIYTEDFSTKNESKIPGAFYSENMMTTTLSTTIHGDGTAALRIDKEKPGVAVFRVTNVGAIRLRGSNDNGDSEDYSFFWSTDNVNYTQINPVRVDLGKGGSFYACDYYFAGFPGGEIYFKVYIPYVKGRERYNRCLLKLEIESETTSIIEDYDKDMLDQFDLSFAENRFMKSTEGTDGETALRFAYMKNTMDKLILTENRFDTEMTRGEFADSLVRIMFAGNRAVDRVYYNSMSDVLSSTDYAGAAEHVTALGYMKCMRDSTFHPEEPVTIFDAEYALMCMLGYQSVVNSGNLYSVARMAEFDAPSKNGNISVRDAAKLIFSAINAYTAADNYNGKVAIGKERFIDRYLKVKKVVGQMTCSRYGTLTDYESDGKNTAVIDGIEVEMSNSSFHENIGRYIYAYVEYDNGRNKVLSYGIENKSVRQPKILKRDFELSASSLNQISYFEDNKSRTLGVKIKKAMINGEREYALSADLYGKCDVLMFFDSDNDGVCDTLVGEKYDNYYVGTQFTAKKGFADYFTSERFYIDDDVYDHISYFCNDAPGSYKDIKIGSVVSVAKSANDKFIKIVICNDFEEGRIGLISNSEDSFKIDEKKYYFSDALKKMVDDGYVAMPEAGIYGKFFFDAVGEMAAYVQTQGTEKYGFLISCGQKKDLTETTMLRIFSDDGAVSDLECAGNVRITCGTSSSKYSDNAVYARLSSDALLTVGGKCEGLIKYRLNGKNEITQIIIPEAIRSENAFSLDYENTAAFTNGSGLINNSYSIDENTKVFYIPYDRGETNVYTNTYKLIQGYEGSGATQNIKLYDTDSARNASAMVVYENMRDGDNKRIDANRFSYVLEIVKEYDEVTERVRDKVRLIRAGSEYEFFTADSLRLRKGKVGSVEADLTDLTVNDLETGDVIYYALNNKGEIGKLTLLYDSDERIFYTTKGESLSETGVARSGEYLILYADIKGVYGKYIYINAAGKDYLLANNANVVILDKNRSKVSIGTTENLDIGDRVAIRTAQSSVTDVYIIR